MQIILVLGRLKKEDPEFKVNQCYTEISRSALAIKKKRPA
jgi:hypothetical protein